jgi:hypothetical protein
MVKALSHDCLKINLRVLSAKAQRRVDSFLINKKHKSWWGELEEFYTLK